MADINELYNIGLSEDRLANEMPEVERIVTLATAKKYPLAAAAREVGKPADSVFRWGAYKRPSKATRPVVDSLNLCALLCSAKLTPVVRVRVRASCDNTQGQHPRGLPR